MYHYNLQNNGLFEIGRLKSNSGILIDVEVFILASI